MQFIFFINPETDNIYYSLSNINHLTWLESLGYSEGVKHKLILGELDNVRVAFYDVDYKPIDTKIFELDKLVMSYIGTHASSLFTQLQEELKLDIYNGYGVTSNYYSTVTIDNLKQIRQNKVAEDSHRHDRIMFIIDPSTNQCYISEPTDTRSHVQYAIDLGITTSKDDLKFNTLIRGYIKDFLLVYYYGENFGPMPNEFNPVEISKTYLNDTIIRYLIYNNLTSVKIYNGVIPGTVGKLWLPINYSGEFEIDRDTIV